MVAISVASILVVAMVFAACGRPGVETGPAPEAGQTNGSSGGTSRAATFTLAFPADPESLTVSQASFYGWTLLDRRDGRTTGSANASTDDNTMESMIKPWLVADYLRRESEAGTQPTDETLDELTLVIVDSNDPLAESYYQQGGAEAVVERLRSVCGLTGLTIDSTWGMTRITPLDAAMYGACLADGRAAGEQWTHWVLDAMRNVRGDVFSQDSGEVEGGRWGIIDGLPPELARDTAIKNGWTLYEDGWHVNCLAIHPEWVLSVMMRMPAELEVAAEGCRAIAAALVVDRSP